MSENLNITLAQINPTVGDLAYNYRKICDAWNNSKDSDLIVFPEMVVCGYPPEDLILKPSFIDEIEKYVEKLVVFSKAKPAAIVPAPTVINGKVYNAMHLIDNGKILATRCKHHLPNYGVFDEQRVFAAAPRPEPVAFRGHSLGLMLCEDMWYPDVAKHLAASGASLLIVPNASPYEAGKEKTRQMLARERVNETGLPFIYVNQIGGQDELVFDGDSFVMNKDGDVVLQMDSFIEEVANITFPFKTPAIKKITESEIITIYKALVLGLRDYIHKNNFPGILIGLSGGIDSALSAAIAVDALGADKVHGVMMPSVFTSKHSLEDAKALAKNLGIQYDSVSIEKPVADFEKLLGKHIKGAPGTTLENLQPRARGLILMALSNASGKMVLSTGNKSEMAVGYATLYGDMCGGFNVLKDVYKTQVYALSRWRNEQSEVIPVRTITKAPTAELRENQTDQDTLPPYDTLDGILESIIEKDLSVDEIVKAGFDHKTVIRVWTMLDRAEYKRRQAPPGIKITRRAFGRDRRYPITNHFSKSLV